MEKEMFFSLVAERNEVIYTINQMMESISNESTNGMLESSTHSQEEFLSLCKSFYDLSQRINEGR
jgi:hypothetical protein